MTIDVRELSLKEIRPDPSQPRKHYDDETLKELAASIKSNRVYEPILVRPKGKGYMIVFGERRFRASKLAGKETIPCMIRDMTDEETLEAQLVENMHRVDPHPMDEAVAFHRFVTMKKLTVEELCARIGKKEFYVRQRLRLNDLTLEWQTVFFRNIILVSDALKIAQLPRDTQEAFYENNIDEHELPKASYKLTFTSQDFDRYKGELQKATFDLADKNLIPDAGACTTCVFNTAYQSLFPGDVNSPRCTRISCFTNKTKLSFKYTMAIVKQDPTVVFVNESGAGSKVAKELEKENLPVLMYNDYMSIEAPDKPDWEEFKEENEDLLDQNEMAAHFSKALSDYDQQAKEYQQKIDSGNFVKAFVVDGEDAGKIKYIKLIKKKGIAALVEGTSTQAIPDDAVDAKAEIERLQDNEKRAKQLDLVKVHNQVKENLDKHQPYLTSHKGLSRNELIATVIMIASFSQRMRSYLDKTFVTNVYGDGIELFDRLATKNDEELRCVAYRAIRHALLERLISGPSIEQDPARHSAAASIRAISLDYFPDTIKTFEEAQGKTAAARIERVNKRVEALQKKLIPKRH